MELAVLRAEVTNISVKAVLGVYVSLTSSEALLSTEYSNRANMPDFLRSSLRNVT